MKNRNHQLTNTATKIRRNKMKTIIFTAAMLLCMNTAMAENDFSTLEGIPAVVMNNEDLKSVEGKAFVYNLYLGWLHVNDVTRVITQLSTGKYLGQLGQPQPAPKAITLQDIQNAFPDPKRPNGGSSQTGKFLNGALFGNQPTKDLSSAHPPTFGGSTRPGTRP